MYIYIYIYHVYIYIYIISLYIYIYVISIYIYVNIYHIYISYLYYIYISYILCIYIYIYNIIYIISYPCIYRYMYHVYISIYVYHKYIYIYTYINNFREKPQKPMILSSGAFPYFPPIGALGMGTGAVPFSSCTKRKRLAKTSPRFRPFVFSNIHFSWKTHIYW